MVVFDMKNRNKKGFSLIEAMIALMLFSMAIYFAGMFVTSSMNRPFIRSSPDRWNQFMMEISTQYLQLSGEHSMLATGSYENPFQSKETPTDFKSLILKTVPSPDHLLICGKFTAFTTNDHQLEWKVCREK